MIRNHIIGIEILLSGVFVVQAATSAQADVTVCKSATNAAIALCPASASPTTECLVTGSKAVAPGAVIDCTGIDVRLNSGGAGGLTVESGSFTLVARNLTVERTRRIEAVANATREVGVELMLTGTLVLEGKLLADNAGSGSFIAVQADGGISLQGTGDNPVLRAAGSSVSTDGGDVILISDGPVAIGKQIAINGADGGDENNVSAGGSLLVNAGGDVTVNEQILATGRWFGGGQVTLISGGSIAINNDAGTTAPKGEIRANGRSRAGFGGEVVLAAANAIRMSGPISLLGGEGHLGGESAGGVATLTAGCGGIVIEDPVDLTGGLSAGGTLLAGADGPIQLAATIDARSRNYGGDGGVVVITSGKTVDVTANGYINVDGHDTSSAKENGTGGLVLISGCSVNVADTTTMRETISAKGAHGGGVALEAGRKMLAAQEISLHVGELAGITTAGTITSGGVYLDVAEQRLGQCSTNVNVRCTLSTQCPAGGCVAPICQYANPDTEGVNSQFTPVPVRETNPNLDPCNSFCP